METVLLDSRITGYVAAPSAVVLTVQAASPMIQSASFVSSALVQLVLVSKIELE
jgi:hypothetical protein